MNPTTPDELPPVVVLRRKPRVAEVIGHLSPFERLLAGLLLLAFIISGTAALYRVSHSLLVEVPRDGGTFTEGIVGTPRFVNPLLANTDADQDLTALVYAGLMTRNPDGTLVPELADHYTVSDDGTTYTFTLRDGLTFQDGVPLTADDVVFTVTEAATEAIRSPLFANWDGVTVKATDAHTVTFTLPQPYAPFIENTTLGILPKHIWNGLSADKFSFSQFNVTPVGAGPYRVVSVVRDRSGIPTSYELAAFDQYALGTPHISHVSFHLYRNSDEALAAYTAGTIDAVHGIAPASIDAALKSPVGLPHTAILRAPQLRIFAVFFNQNKQPVFLHDEVRRALDEATPRMDIVGTILHGYGTALDTPLPPYLYTAAATEDADTGTESGTAGTSTASSTPQLDHIARAQQILEHAGWARDATSGVYMLKQKKGDPLTLSFTLSTVNTPELNDAAQRIVAAWRDMGAQVDLKVYDPSDLAQSIIRPRRYEALLFGEVIGHEADMYAFWHSSQRNDPGLNVAEFADIEADAALEKARTELDPTKRKELFGTFVARVADQHAAVFLYAPDFVYLVHDRVQNVSLHPIADPSDRFDGIQNWYIETDSVWPFVQQFID